MTESAPLASPDSLPSQDSLAALESLTAPDAARLYALISADAELTRSLFRQALQDPKGTLARIRELGLEHGMDISESKLKTYLATLDDDASKQWLIKARGGL